MIGLSLSFVACSNENGADDSQPVNPPTLIGENLIVCNEGNWQSDNGQLSYYDGTAGVLTNKSSMCRQTGITTGWKIASSVCR